MEIIDLKYLKQKNGYISLSKNVHIKPLALITFSSELSSHEQIVFLYLQKQCEQFCTEKRDVTLNTY